MDSIAMHDLEFHRYKRNDWINNILLDKTSPSSVFVSNRVKQKLTDGNDYNIIQPFLFTSRNIFQYKTSKCVKD